MLNEWHKVLEIVQYLTVSHYDKSRHGTIIIGNKKKLST